MPVEKAKARTVLDGTELNVTLNAKLLAKPLADALLTPFLNAVNKKRAGEPPLSVSSLSRVEVDGKVVPLDALASDVLTHDAPRVELFTGEAPAPVPTTAPATKPAAMPAPAPAPAAAPAPAPAAAPAPAPVPAPAAAPAPAGAPMASNTMPRCKYGLACRIITPEEEMSTNLPKEQQHWYKFQHPCYWVCKEGHPELGPPGVKVPLHTRFGMTGVLGRGAPCPPCAGEMCAANACTNFDPDHRRCFRHPEDDPEAKEEVVDEAPDELDEAVLRDEPAWEAPDVGEVGEEAAMEAKMAAAEAAGDGDFEGAVLGYTKALKGAPSALVYAKRAEALLRLGRPSAAVADCARALEANPDSGKAYKVAAKALTKKGEWEEAYAKVCTGMKIDYDDAAAELQKTLKAKVDKMKKIAAQKAKREAAEEAAEAPSA